MRSLRLAAALAAVLGAGSGVAAGPVPGAGGERPEGGSTAQNPTVVFTTAGPKAVTLTVCNQAGECSSVTHTALVLDPRPAVTGFSVTPARLEERQSVLLDATGTGQPPLSYSWRLLHNAVVIGTLFGAHVTW